MGRLRITGVMVLVGLLAACAPRENEAPPMEEDATAAPSAEPVGTARGLELRLAMRDLWADHVMWTRDYVAAAVAGQPAEAAAARLMKNQEEIGKAMEPFYGAEAGTKLTELLKEHITIATDVVAAAKANDQVTLTDADRRWHDNAAEIATFLSGANPNWSQSELLEMLNEHLSLTTQEATARIQKNWAADIEAFDRVFDQAMKMADALTDGIIKQFPDKV